MTPSKHRLKTPKRQKPNRQLSPRTPQTNRILQSPTTPVFISSGNISPQLVWASQETHDGVSWNDTSPLRQQLLSGKTDVNEYLQYVNDKKANEQDGSLLATWFSARHTNITLVQQNKSNPPERVKRKVLQKFRHARHELEELTEAVDEKEKFTFQDSRLFCTDKSENIETEEFDIGNDETEACISNDHNTSAEELWGADNESFILKATQIAEAVEDTYSINGNLLLGNTVQLTCIKPIHSLIAEESVSNHSSDRYNIEDPDNSLWLQCTQSFENIEQQTVPQGKQDMSLVVHNDGTTSKTKPKVADSIETFWESDSSIDEIISSLPEDQLTGIKSHADTRTNPIENKLSTNEQDDSLRAKTDSDQICKNREIHHQSSSYSLRCTKTQKENLSDEISDKYDSLSPSSTESNSTAYQKYTAAEIKRKRAEALKRRQKKHHQEMYFAKDRQANSKVIRKNSVQLKKADNSNRLQKKVLIFPKDINKT